MMHPKPDERPSAAELSKWSPGKESMSLLKPYTPASGVLSHSDLPTDGAMDAIVGDSRNKSVPIRSTLSMVKPAAAPSKDNARTAQTTQRVTNRKSSDAKKRDSNGRTQSTLTLTKLFA